MPGPVRFNAVWYYEPAAKRDALAFRTLRCSYAAVALPSLSVTAHILAGAPWSVAASGDACVFEHRRAPRQAQAD